MIVISPLVAGLATGGLQAGMGIFGAFNQQQAARQQYLNDVTFQNANNRFSMWQAGFSSRVQDANKQHQFWQETVNYNQQLAYANSQRNVELLRAADQAKVVAETRASAGASYVGSSDAIADQFAQAEMSAAVAQQQYTWRALSARSSVRAMEMEGNSVDRIVNNYAFQLGDAVTLAAIESDWRENQYTDAQAQQVTQYLNQWNSQSFYESQTIFDPIAPFAPLPTLMTPPPPSRTGAPPSNAAFATSIASGLIGGVSQGFSTYSGMNRLKTPSSSQGPGTGTPFGAGFNFGLLGDYSNG